MAELNSNKKYKIEELLLELSVTEYEKAVKALPELLNRSRRQFYRMKGTAITDKYSITTDQAQIIANYFQVSVDYLINKTAEDDVTTPHPPKIKRRSGKKSVA